MEEIKQKSRGSEKNQKFFSGKNFTELNRKLTRRENYINAARRKPHEWIPLDFGMSTGFKKIFRRHAGENTTPEEYFDFDTRWTGGPLPSTRPTPDWRKLYYDDGSLPESAVINPDWGTAWDYFESSDDATQYFPLRNVTSVSELDAFPWPDIGVDYRYEGHKEKIESLQQADYPVIMGGFGVFENTWALSGFEKLLMEMFDDSPVTRKLFHKMAELQVRTAEQVARCGADVLFGGGDVATQQSPMMSPAMWHDWIFPIMRDCISAAKRIKPDILVFYHSDGNVEPLIEGFIEAGVDILNPIQPECMDIFALKKKYGDRISFHGGIGVQSTLPFGTPQEVRDTVRRTIEVMAKNGGYLCSSAHMLRPEIPWKNVMAFVETVHSYKI